MTTRVFIFHYTLTNDEGEVLDSSQGKDPLAFFEGGKQIIPDLEAKLVTMQVGDKDKIRIEAARAYGVRRDDMVITLTRDQLPDGDMQVGMKLQTQKEGNVQVFEIKSIEGDKVVLDGNHPLADADLTFDIELTDIRNATEEEIKHGHVHGAGGHNH